MPTAEPVVGDDTIVWPDMSELLPCERPRLGGVLAPGVPLVVNCFGRNPAEWILWASCCDRPPMLWCGECKDGVLALPDVFCHLCGHVSTPPSLAYSRIEPLNGGGR